MDELSAQAKQIIEKNIYMTIATASKDGQPWNTPVYCAFDEQYNFYWNSRPDAQHSKNIAVNPDVFIVIYDSSAEEGTGDGVYIKARARMIEGEAEAQKALDLLFHRKGSESKPAADFLGDNPRRVYKAVPEKFWMNTDEKINGYHNDGRAEVSPIG
jgi:nitroimidazol reductase NimA-like FMN-containing flavoprotein (pyridoxamine 5'-phosphate oxidase superfamily)